MEVLRQSHTPSMITSKFPTGLQTVIMGACPTVDCCARVESPMLSVLSQAYPAMMDENGNTVQSPCIVWMRAQFTEVSAFANVKQKMTDWQVDNLCLQILAEFPSLTMMEFILFCARLRSGIYEDFYGNVDPMRIMKSFRSFIEDRRQDYNRKYEEDRKAKEEHDAEESKKNAKGLDWLEDQVKQGKFLTLATLWGIEIPEEYQEEAKALEAGRKVIKASQQPKKKEETIEDILKVAKSLLAEKDANVRLQFEKIFKKKYGCFPQEYIDKNVV